MATWHQDQRPTQLWHATKWTVVSDPVHECRILSMFSTYDLAKEYITNLEKHGNGDHCYIIPPHP